MDIQATKLDLINWLTSLSDESIISKILAIRTDNSDDWYNDLTTSQKKAVQKSITEADAGNTISHSEVMQKMKMKIQQLKNH